MLGSCTKVRFLGPPELYKSPLLESEKVKLSPPFVTVNPLIGCVATSFIVRVTVSAFDRLATSESSNPAVAAMPKRAYFDFIIATRLRQNSASPCEYSEQRSGSHCNGHEQY